MSALFFKKKNQLLASALKTSCPFKIIFFSASLTLLSWLFLTSLRAPSLFLPVSPTIPVVDLQAFPKSEPRPCFVLYLPTFPSNFTPDSQTISIYTYVYTHTHIYFIYIYILPFSPQNDSWTKMSYKLLKKHSFFLPKSMFLLQSFPS